MVLINCNNSQCRSRVETKLRLCSAVLLMVLVSSCAKLPLYQAPSKSPVLVPATQPELTVDKPQPNFPQRPTYQEAEPKPETENRETDDQADIAPYESQAPASNLLASLLAKASKAIASQQWLRAQRTLEQALRVKPNSPDVYVLYAEVYEGLGIPEKASQMRKRASMLSGK